MNKQQRSILRAFTRESLKKIAADLEQHVAKHIPNYVKIETRVDFKRDLRSIVEPFESIEAVAELEKHTDQLAHALDLLWEARRHKDDDLITILKELIEKHLVPVWNGGKAQGALVAEYRWRAQVVTEWKDFFLSYTLRQATETNNDFLPLIGQMYPKVPEGNALAEENYVATIVERLFNRAGLRCFYDKKSIAIGERIGKTVKKYCRRSFTFVQLVEEEALNPPDDRPDKTNWCYVEWKEFGTNPKLRQLLADRAGDCRIFFVTESELLEPVDPYPPYERWISDVKARLHQRLGGCDKTAVRKKVREVATIIKGLRDDAVDEALTVM